MYNMTENLFALDKIKELKTNGHTVVYGYRIEEMDDQSVITLYKLFRNMYRAKAAGCLDEMIEKYLEKLESK